MGGVVVRNDVRVSAIKHKTIGSVNPVGRSLRLRRGIILIPQN